MTTRPFVHLHCHSHYSLLDGAGDIGKLIKRCKEHGMNALALTDHGNLHGALEFYRKAKEAGINPIIGYEAYIAPGSRHDRGGATGSKDASYHLTLLAQNRAGFKNLVKLASAASLEGFYYKPRIDKEILKAHSEGIICLSGCVSSEFSRAVLKGLDTAEAEKEARDIVGWFQGVFGDRYFIEVMNNGVEIQRLQLQGAVDIAARMGLPVVTTSDTHYVDPEDAEAQDIMLCINTGRFRTDTSRMKMDGNQYFLRSPEQMYQQFPGLEDAVARSQQIADSVDIDLELGKHYFPKFECPNQAKPIDYLRELCIRGLLERYEGNAKRLDGDQLNEEVMARLERELGVIEKLGYPTYFLIVWDFVIHARDKGIWATARGSGVGAIVCYALYMSHVCPLEYDLLFERFLDESRIEPPDIDIDFDKDRRIEVIDYVKEKYGHENVCQIGTFGTLAARAAIKDTGRALGVPLARVNQITEMVPDELKITLPKALKQSEELKQTYDNDPEIRELIDLAMRIEGLARNVGTHAAAVVIADKPLSEYVPLCRVSGKQEVITQWSMNDVEASGLLKMDFLGLRNLTILSKAVDLIQQTTGQRIDPLKFPLDDKKTYALLQRGETKGVFQLESGGIRDLLQRMKPDQFTDIIATNALYRPGPLEGGMVDDFVNIKHGRQQPEYKHPVLKEILGETNSIMVYQEQVMRILNRLGNIPLAAAYTVIKAISKKKESLINLNHEKFLEGSIANGLKKEDADEIWSLIQKFAGYGFNKCVVGSTEIMDAESGTRATVGDLFRNRRPFKIHSLGDDWKLRPRKVTDVVWNGVAQTYRLTTRTGRQITATANHPLRTIDGWKTIDSLAVGEQIATARSLAVSGRRRWDMHALVTLGWLLAEGNVCHPTCLYFYSNDAVQAADFAEHAANFPNTAARITTRPDQRRIEVCLSTGSDMRFSALSSGGVGTAVAAKRNTGLRCGAFLWAKELGLLGLTATKKKVPDEVFELSTDQIAVLIGRLWAGDGYIEQSGQQSYFATSSPTLAANMQTLLTRLGIVSRVTKKLFRYRPDRDPGGKVGYTVHLLGFESKLQFLEIVGPHIVGKEQAVSDFLLRLRNGGYRTSGDLIPVPVNRLVATARVQQGLSWRELEKASGVSIKELCRVGPSKKRGFQRVTINRLSAFFNSNELAHIASSDVYWDEIVSIEPAAVEDVYDLTVDEDHNFVAGGIVVHNSHSTAYALVAYQTAYLKAHYPVEFMAALLSSDITGRNFKRKDALVEHMEDCARMGIEVVAPSVNHSNSDFAVNEGKILFALSAIKGCGGGAAEAISAARKAGGPFSDVFEFCERVDIQSCNRAAIETLIKAGAMDCFGAQRSQLSAAVEKALQIGAAALADRKSGQASLFGAFDDEPEETAQKKVVLPDVPPWPEKQQLIAEKEVLGFYLTSHPMAEHEPKLAAFRTHNTDQLSEVTARSEVLVGGMIGSIKFAHTKNGKPGTPSKYANFDLEDMQGVVRCILWPRQFAEQGDAVVPDAVVIARGVIDRRGGGDEVNLVVNELLPLASLDSKYTHGIRIALREDQHDIETMSKLREIIRGYPGHQDLLLTLRLDEGETVVIKSRKYKVQVDSEMRTRLEDLLGPASYRLQMTKPQISAGGGRRG